ncbi:hypothetical protein KCU95_g7616, partial [Aureobasidium melanogenum]
MPRTKQTSRPPKPEFHHDELTTPLTKARRTSIQMPNLRRDEVYSALFILDKTPRAIIDEVIVNNRKHTGGYFFWLAEENFEALLPDDTDELIKPTIPADWVSRFAGKTVEDAFRFIATLHLEARLDRQFIAVLDIRLYKEKDWLVIYRVDEQGEITSIPCKAELTCMQMRSYGNHNWPTFMDDWQRTGKPILR